MRLALIAAVLAISSPAVSTQAQEVCSGESCADDSSVGEVSLMQKSIGLKKQTEKGKADTENVPAEPALADQLAYLAGHVATKTSLRNMMGWEEKVAMVDEGKKHYDQAVVFTKVSDDGNKSGALVFSATDDMGDIIQQFKGGLVAIAEFCGFSGWNGGYVEEIKQYMKLEKWTEVMDELKSCNHVYSVGTSMGGAVASVFAYCANTLDRIHRPLKFGAPAGTTGALPEVHLYTFGAPGVAQSPIYNGRPDRCFSGERRVLTPPVSRPGKEFVLDNLELFANMSTRMRDTAGADSLKNAMAYVKSAPRFDSEEVETLLQSVYTNLKRKWLFPYVMLAGASIKWWGIPFIGFKLKFEKFIEKHKDELDYPYDPVPQLFDESMGFKHPLMAVHSDLDSSDTDGCAATNRMAVLDDRHRSSFPKNDFAQLFWGLMKFNMENYARLHFPNHRICCMVAVPENCKARYFDPAKIECKNFATGRS